MVLTGSERYCGPLSGISSGPEGLFPLFLEFPVVFKALFPGIPSGIQGLNQRQALNGIVAPLNGLDRPLMVLWPSFWDFEWY